MLSIAGVDFVLEQSDRGALLVKAGKPCGRGWIAEKKRCDPKKLQHALKERRPDLERYANTKREAKGLKPKQKAEFQDISLADLEASDKMLEESLAMFDVPVQVALAEPPLKFEEALNNIVPFNKGQENLVRELRADLLDLQNLATEFVLEQRDRKLSDSLDALKDELSNNKLYLEALQSEILKNKVDKLNRIYKGKITQSDAEISATLTRVFHALHPRKQIKMPKGTTQVEYLGIVNKLLDGDKKALKQYTVTRPSKKKKGKK